MLFNVGNNISRHWIVFMKITRVLQLKAQLYNQFKFPEERKHSDLPTAHILTLQPKKRAWTWNSANSCQNSQPTKHEQARVR